MPARDPLLSPRNPPTNPHRPLNRTPSALGPGMSDSARANWNSLYLPDTSLNYDSDEEALENSYVARGHSQRRRSASGDANGSPSRPNFQRRDSGSTHRSDAFSDTPDGIRSRTAFFADMPHDESLARSMSNHPPSIPASVSHPHLNLAMSAMGGPPKEPEHLRRRSSDHHLTGPAARFQQQPRLHGHGIERPLLLDPSQAVTANAPSLPPVTEASNSPGESPPQEEGISPAALNPSNLSRLMAKDRSPGVSPTRSPDSQRTGKAPVLTVHEPSEPSSSTTGSNTPTPTRRNTTIDLSKDDQVERQDLESAPLLLSNGTDYGTIPLTTYDHDESPKNSLAYRLSQWKVSAQKRSHDLELTHASTYTALLNQAAHSLPAVILGLLLNILDGVSYGFIMFPAGSIFAGFGGLGVSMFFVTTIVSQLTYSFGGSIFKGGNGSMMIEVVPFFHILASGIIAEVGEDNPTAVIATTMVAFATSSILTGITFFALGHFKLGNLIGFFPRHILVGCIGGVGVFLVETGFEVSASINSNDGFQYNLETFKLFFMTPSVLTLWVPAFGLAVLLRLITAKYHHQLIFPLYCLSIPCIFYIVVAIAGIDIATLREGGWVFNIGANADPWYKFYTYFDFQKTSFRALWRTLPTQLALLFFNILHPPLNVPALAVSLGEDNVDTNHELVAHGISNVLAGLLGTVPNYLVYVNTLMFYRVGGGCRLSGFMLAAGTAVLLVVGTGPIGYIPIMVVGALIFVLGLDLIKEAVWDTRHRTSTTEYITIVAIMVCMSLYDFVIGVLFGIILACFFFVVQNSRRMSVRALYTGASSVSTVRRPSAHRKYLQEVGKQTIIMRLQGFLFFGTINAVEETIRHLFDVASWQENPIRFLLIDLTLVGGCDMSSAEAFVRVQRLLAGKNVILIFCGIGPESAVAKALQGVNLWVDRGLDLEVFSSLGEAMEWTENAYLRAWFSSTAAQKTERVDNKAIAYPGQRQNAPFALGESFANSPRRSHIHNVGERFMQDEAVPTQPDHQAEPLNTLMKAFSSFSDGLDESFFLRLVPYLEQMVVPKDFILFSQGDEPDGLYLIEHGVLRAKYDLMEHTQVIEESMVSGTLAGELSSLSRMPRNATVFAERQSVLWKLSIEELEKLENEDPAVAKVFVKLVLKAAKIDYDVLLSALASRA